MEPKTDKVIQRGCDSCKAKPPLAPVATYVEAPGRSVEAPGRRLILTVGLPRSGKTTWARQQGHPIVNPDSIRLALHGQRFYGPAEPTVWATAKLMVAALFGAGHETVILDATNVSAKRRDDWKSYEPTMQIFETDPATCIARAWDIGDEAIVPVIKRMAEEWDLPASWRPLPKSPFVILAPRPTIAELEDMLGKKGSDNVEILPNGDVAVRR